ncbi:unnamed protein product [Lactuca saligna]|uniref:Uncharacterized protein n=1 Tax=Lactuca saligna TaxID=75948 RepID=A0AA36DWN6_LACSI|nr:unnamed protein product [Lactuca saligna]
MGMPTRGQEPIQPAISGQAMPRRRIIRDSYQLFTGLEDEHNHIGMKNPGTGNNTDSNGGSITLAHKLHCREEPSRVSDDNNKTPNNRAKCKINWAKEKGKCERHQSMEDEIRFFHTQSKIKEAHTASVKEKKQ